VPFLRFVPAFLTKPQLDFATEHPEIRAYLLVKIVRYVAVPLNQPVSSVNISSRNGRKLTWAVTKRHISARLSTPSSEAKNCFWSLFMFGGYCPGHTKKPRVGKWLIVAIPNGAEKYKDLDVQKCK
jgi:hypothetical protein